jgi:hypothetical protein
MLLETENTNDIHIDDFICILLGILKLVMVVKRMFQQTCYYQQMSNKYKH